MNATYGVSMELLSGGSMLKESSFDFLLGDDRQQQHIVSVGLFTRGLNSFAGSSNSGNEEDEDDEAIRGGIALRIMGMTLRPYTLFVGKGALLGHIWSATASRPLTVYRGNLLLSDHEDSVPLVNGFIVRQKLTGVASVDLSGSIDVSLFYRTSDSKVSCKIAALMQGSQAIGSGDPRTSVQQLFAFGGATSIDTLTNVDFSSDPKMCVKMQHPDKFVLRSVLRLFPSLWVPDSRYPLQTQAQHAQVRADRIRGDSPADPPTQLSSERTVLWTPSKDSRSLRSLRGRQTERDLLSRL